MSAGISNVMMTNHLERTRSMNSRLMTTNSLSMAGHPLFDALGADTLNEDLMQRWLDELEALDDRARLHQAFQNFLSVSAGNELQLEETVLVVDFRDETLVGENRRKLRPRVADRNGDVLSSVRR